MDLLDRLLGHDAWTTAALLERARTLSDAQLDQDINVGHRTVRLTLEHIIDNMETWTDLMNGVPQRTLLAPPEQWRTLDGLHERLRTVTPQLAQLARRIRQENAWDDLWTDYLDDPPQQKTYGGALAHLITHSMHHRAQLIHMLRHLNAPDVPEGDVLSWETEHSKGQSVPG
ncbi:DinB family protein [Deinococcus fonticola]|uniref:DinB family protein n=1 Tax=Deinococcus fonticola TaxID=2528713 RepID=UPI0010754704|nr:DinB family protein [Deinococcus fonticola]